MCNDKLPAALLPDEELPLAPSYSRDLVRLPDCLPQIVMVPSPFPHPAVAKVFADVDAHSVDVEGKQKASLVFVMNFIHMNSCFGTVKVTPPPEAYLSPSIFALHMARFPEAERRLLHKMICMQRLARPW